MIIYIRIGVLSWSILGHMVDDHNYKLIQHGRSGLNRFECFEPTCELLTILWRLECIAWMKKGWSFSDEYVSNWDVWFISSVELNASIAIDECIYSIITLHWHVTCNCSLSSSSSRANVHWQCIYVCSTWGGGESWCGEPSGHSIISLAGYSLAGPAKGELCQKRAASRMGANSTVRASGQKSGQLQPFE